MRVLDYCAGGGGKALGMADLAAVTVTAHDIDPGRMVDLPVRAARAGVRIDICGTADLPQAAYDLVLCDAPCSGSGTWRRTPEAKWHLTPARLAELCALQAEVLANGAAVVAPGGVLAYATCSVLDVENAAQIDAFLARNPGWQATEALRTAPGPAGDGFYLSVIRKPA
jgi:16S rRNA (cytosine967-C5)-methyltransferase